MKRTPIFSLLLAALFSLATFAGERPDESFREKEKQAKELAEEVLTGRQVCVRVYDDWKRDPRAYKLVSVELDGLSFQCDAVKRAFGQMSESAVIAVAGEDQTDEAAAVVLQDFVYVESYKYKKGGSLSVWPRYHNYDREESLKPCAFKDSLNNPIPNAIVEIWMGVDRYLASGPRVFIARAKLDEAGLLQSPVFISSWHPSFIVHHPDCGRVKVIYLPPSSSDDSYRSFLVPALPKDTWCVFRDALGNPIPNATVEIFTGSRRDYNQRVLIRKVKLDEKGRLKPFPPHSRLEWCHFIVSHPEYGTAIAEPRQHYPSDKTLTSCTVPLVRAGSKADERSIWGTVVDANENPVAGALIECRGVRTPGGGGISTPMYATYKVLTDKDGQFYMYFPIEKDSDKHGNLIPLASKYSARIEASGLRNYLGEINSGEETTITMFPPGHGGYFHTFLFEDEIGPITDPNQLGKIYITVKHDRGLRSFQYNYWKKGGRFPLGTYQARIIGPGGLRFEAIEVTPDSPTLLVFRVQETIVYHGQVVHGITGKPMQGAIVMTGHIIFSGEDASSIEPEQWETLHTLAANPYADDQALTDLKESIDFEKITQTDENGSFLISFATGEDTYFSDFYALERDYLCASHHTRDLKPNKDRLIEVGTMKLFPAATLIVEPNLPAETNSSYDIRLRWSMDPNNNPPWLNNFRSGAVVSHRLLRPPNRVHSIHLPAGLEMTLRIYNVPAMELCPIIIPDLKLEQGQILDLGRRDFQPNFKVAVKIIDSSGEPVEGVTVDCYADVGMFLGQKAITNEDGIAFLYVPPHSKGRFTVRHYEEPLPDEPLRESTVYEVGGEEDAGKQFTLQISDEMLYQLFK
ncbi:MAG: hypothetical protein PVJ86_00980 [Phycisphaerales bacterium]|jgi:hypothetical protein